jgi:ribosome recycling factor
MAGPGLFLKVRIWYDTGMTLIETYIKDLETALAGVTGKLKADLAGVQGNRPSADAIQNITLSLYDQTISIRELGSLSVLPPRTIQITVWDKDAVNPVVKAIEAAHMGLTASNDGTTIRATVSALGDERRDELTKLVKKTAETARIQLRARRDDIMKRVKDSEVAKELTKDDVFKGKEKVQKVIDKVNAEIDAMVDAKLEELGE